MHRTLLTLLLPLLPSANGFSVSFRLGEQCRGAAEGTFNPSGDPIDNGNGTISFPCYQVPVNAQSATVNAEDGDSSTDNVAFWSNRDCTGTLEASADSGCIDFTGLGGNALGYQVLNDGLDNRKMRRRSRRTVTDSDQNPWSSQQNEWREKLNIQLEHATGSLAPHWDPYASTRAGYGHGNITERWGTTWKWQQVALGVTVGIPIDEWDDEVHTMSEEFVVFGDHDGTFSPRKRSCGSTEDAYSGELSPLLRRWDYANCRGLLTCSRNIFNAAAVNIGNGWSQVTACGAKLVPIGQKFYDWAHAHPWTCNIALTGAGTLAGFGLGKTGGGATAQDNDQLASCSGDQSQVQSFVQGVVDVAGAGENNAAEATITLENGHILSISAEVYPADHPPPKGTVYCDAA